jgi:hypothetical protein
MLSVFMNGTTSTINTQVSRIHLVTYGYFSHKDGFQAVPYIALMVAT